jgi:hypothetical protein
MKKPQPTKPFDAAMRDEFNGVDRPLDVDPELSSVAGFADAEEPTSPAVPHPSKPPLAAEPNHYDATAGSRFSVKQANAAAILHQLHQLLDDSFHAVDVGLLPAGCRITVIIEP